EIGQGNPDAIAGLLEIIRTTEDQDTRGLVAYSLGEIGQGNPDAIAGLLEIIRTTEDEDTRRLAAWSVGKILTTPEEYAGVVSALKDCLSDEVYENNFDLFKASYKLICNCAENLPYPEFYQPWHNLPTTPHP
ncbi:HEAT repeat domain-containing protein, partial [Limnospira sp. PMC 289.06]|uniref:HEAT repeat domain-containing protein n=1 Tax=Limnospira sp. PMC 289.06 TaxID=2981094 RepID=UPI0028E16BCC|nr:HEAT repeat domain-containing protein [Limnospira sp. PMC 289.06]